jgi:4-amino-4-deoxy-L-arabinose transferase
MTVFEGHGGPWWFYFSNIKTLYGLIFLILLPIAVFISIYRIGSKAVAAAFLSMPIFVYIFFTLSKTKMPGFTFVISLPLLFSMAVLLDYIITYFNRLTIPVNIKRLCVILLLSAIGFLNLRLPTILANHSQSGPNMFYRSVCIQNKKVFESLKTKVPLNSVIFNLYGRTYVDCMFYSGLAAYNFIPSVDQYTELKRKNKIIVIFLKAGQALPRYLQEDKSIVLKRDFIRACE